MFRALKYLKRPTVMVRFPDESHELSRSGRPCTASSGCSTSSGWFDVYLMGKSNEVYEVQLA
jgi:dipeptidyl aminopeptidase/acylaminoacyl peptidase